jgi:3'-5' exoribonuclease
MAAAPARNAPIAQWRDGEQVQGFAYLARKEERQDRKGNTYLHLELADRSGAITGKVWPDNQAILGRFEALQFVAIEGLVQRYREELQLVVRRCRAAVDDDRQHGFDETLLVPTTREDIGELWRRLEAALDRVARPVLRRLAADTLQEHGAALREHPAAKSIHHAYRGGLLEHVVSMLELAGSVGDHYPELDRDLLLVGVLFHDLGKLRELGAMPLNDYSKEGRLVGHIVLGRDLLLARCAAIDGFPPDLRLQLEHLVLAHQGHREYGSPVEPMTAEALALHFVDDLDSKLNQLRRARELGWGFQYLRPMGRHIYLGEEPLDEHAPEAAGRPEPAGEGNGTVPSQGGPPDQVVSGQAAPSAPSAPSQGQAATGEPVLAPPDGRREAAG